MAIDRRMARLRARHSHEIRDSFRAFAVQWPLVEVGVRGAVMTPAEDAAYREHSRELIERHRRERAELAAALRGEG